MAFDKIEELASDEIFRLKKGRFEELMQNHSIFESRLD